MNLLTLRPMSFKTLQAASIDWVQRLFELTKIAEAEIDVVRTAKPAMFEILADTKESVRLAIVCDAGLKSMGDDAVMPERIGVKGVRSVALSAEHSVVELDESHVIPRVGDKLESVVGYSDATVHLHDVVFGCRNGMVEVVWPVWGRGKTH